jgi:hypothetical protein
MPARRTAALPLVTAGLALLPGCVVIPAAGDSPTQNKTAGANPAARPRFAEYITAPGQRIAPNDTTVQQPGGEEPHRPVPIESAVAATGSVQPPTPEPRPELAPPPVDPPLVAAVRAYLDSRPDLAVEHLRGFDPPNQELLRRLLPAVALARNADLKDPAAVRAIADQVGSATDAVARTAPLRIGKACFVWQVKQFGVYDPLPPGHQYLPGGMAVLYAEVENAPSDPTPHPGGGDGYVTRLTCELELLDAAGRSLAKYTPANVPDMAVADYTRSRLKDVFLRMQFQVPKAPGAYALVFDVRDPATGRAVRKAVEFRVSQ